MTVNVVGGNMNPREVSYYAQQIRKNNPGMEVESMTLKIGEDNYVDVDYQLIPIPFERIRRITGYLVGTVDRFNNAKRAEEHDRVKHMSCCN